MNARELRNIGINDGHSLCLALMGVTESDWENQCREIDNRATLTLWRERLARKASGDGSAQPDAEINYVGPRYFFINP